jgi:hypothetical protein
VRPHADGHSYCGRCLAQVERIEQDEREQLEDERGALPDLSPPPLEEPVATKASKQQPAPAAAGSRPDAAPPAEPRTEQPAASPAPEANAATPASTPARERAMTAAITGSEGGDALTQALSRERSALQQRRHELVEQLHGLEGEVQSVSRRIDHVDALLSTGDQSAPASAA